jgi:hypothetical protein
LFQGVAISGASLVVTSLVVTSLVVTLDEEISPEGVNQFADTLRAFRQLLQSEFARL